MTWQGNIVDEATRRGTFAPTGRFIAGGTVGVIAVQLDYAKLPGNVVNPATYRFPVIFERVDFEIERLFAGDPTLVDVVIDAARRLQAQGASVIVGACGFFAHFQDAVADAVDVPVFLSSLTQISLIELGLKRNQKIAVFAADGSSITPELLSHVGAKPDRLIVRNVGDRPAFQAIRWGKDPLNNGALIDDMCALAVQVTQEHPEVGAILLECSDLPPYAADVQRATGLPVYDFITLINWAHQAVCQPVYYGYC